MTSTFFGGINITHIDGTFKNKIQIVSASKGRISGNILRLNVIEGYRRAVRVLMLGLSQL